MKKTITMFALLSSFVISAQASPTEPPACPSLKNATITGIQGDPHNPRATFSLVGGPFYEGVIYTDTLTREETRQLAEDALKMTSPNGVAYRSLENAGSYAWVCEGSNYSNYPTNVLWISVKSPSFSLSTNRMMPK